MHVSSRLSVSSINARSFMRTCESLCSEWLSGNSHLTATQWWDSLDLVLALRQLFFHLHGIPKLACMRGF